MPENLLHWSAYLDLVLERQVLTIEELERRAYAAALKRTGGNVTHVMHELGVGRTTVYRKLRKYGLRGRGHVRKVA